MKNLVQTCEQKIIKKFKITKMPTICVKVANLRKLGYSNLEEWMETPNNIYVGRRGRIFITENGTRRVFVYPGSVCISWECVGKSI